MITEDITKERRKIEKKETTVSFISDIYIYISPENGLDTMKDLVCFLFL